jgi:hypothetical protein
VFSSMAILLAGLFIMYECDLRSHKLADSASTVQDALGNQLISPRIYSRRNEFPAAGTQECCSCMSHMANDRAQGVRAETVLYPRPALSEVISAQLAAQLLVSDYDYSQLTR